MEPNYGCRHRFAVVFSKTRVPLPGPIGGSKRAKQTCWHCVGRDHGLPWGSLLSIVAAALYPGFRVKVFGKSTLNPKPYTLIRLFKT